MNHDDSNHGDGIGASTTATSECTDESGVGVPRRRLLAAAGAAAAASLAGCSVLGGDGDGDSGGSDGREQTIRSDVDGIEVVDATGEAGDDTYQITVTVENTGGEDTGVLDYSYTATLYDGDGAEISTRGGSVVNKGGFWDSDTGEVLVKSSTTADPGTVASFDLVVGCDGFADGIYCEE